MASQSSSSVESDAQFHTQQPLDQDASAGTGTGNGLKSFMGKMRKAWKKLDLDMTTVTQMMK